MSFILVPFRTFQSFYTRNLETKPILTKCFTAGIIVVFPQTSFIVRLFSNRFLGTMFLGGDLLCQVIENRHQKWSEWKMDLKRTARMTIFGFAVLGPAGMFDY